VKTNVTLEEGTKERRLKCVGDWRTHFLKDVDLFLRNVGVEDRGPLFIDLDQVSFLDTAGALIIRRFMARMRLAGMTCTLKTQNPLFLGLLSTDKNPDLVPPPQPIPPPFFLGLLENMGKKTLEACKDALVLISFLGEVVLALLALVRRPGRLRLTATVYHLGQVGMRAVPIVGLISFLIGVVLVYQSANQLKRFGAEVFTVDLLAVSVLRELGILLTSIVVAGRSGSAFTAQIGYMQLNQEIDAMRIMSLDPVTYLVLPRLIALMIALPLLGFFANMMAILGGAIMGNALIGLTFSQFMTQLNMAIGPWTFWTGMIKGPFFAFVISLVGCFEGLRVRGGAESVGSQTTKSVVKSIFLVIVMDAVFSILFSYIGI
jgi:phospholipid/cholesterol/gamma-HCH transport system permease protein